MDKKTELHYLYYTFSPKVTKNGWWEAHCICGYKGVAGTRRLAEVKVMGHIETISLGYLKPKEKPPFSLGFVDE